MKSHFRLAFLCAVFLFSLLAGNGYQETVLAQASVDNASPSEQPKCWALDVAIMLDVSGSMNGDNGSDPDGYRFDAVAQLINELIKNRQQECPEVVHRFALITFAGQARTNIELTRIDIGLGVDSEEWVEAKFRRAIESAQSGRDLNTSFTNFEAAFAATKDMFSKALPMSEPLGYGPRRKLAIFVTDGKPTLNINDSSSSLPTTDLMCSWRNQLVEDPFWSNISIWILPLRAQTEYLNEIGCDGKSVRSNFDELVSTKGQGKLTDFGYTKQTIPLFVSELIANEFGKTTERISCNSPFIVNPYSQRVEFTISSEKGNDPIVVTVIKLDEKTGDEIYKLRAGKWIDKEPERPMPIYYPELQKNGYEQFTIYNPMPGRWEYEVEGMEEDVCRGKVEGIKADVVADFDFSAEGAVFNQIAEPPYYDPNITSDKPPFVVQLRIDPTQNNNFFIEQEWLSDEPDYSLDVEVTWTLPSGSQTLPNGQTLLPTKLVYSDEAKGWVNAPDKPLLTPETGTYKLTIVGKAPDLKKNSDFELFRKEASFQVSALEPFKFILKTPANDAVLSCNAIKDEKSVPNDIPVTIQLQDKDGQPAQAINYISSDHAKVFVAELFDANQQLIDSVYLQPEKDGLFHGVLLDKQTEIKGCGKVTLKIRFDGETNKKSIITQSEFEWNTERAESQGVKVFVANPVGNEVLRRFSSPWNAWPIGKAQPISITFNLNDLNGNPLNAAQLFISADKPFYQVRLKAPGSDIWQELDVSPGSTSTQLVATGGTDISKEGTYLYEILPVDGAFARGFVAAQDKINGSFERRDNFWTSPTFGMILWGISSLIVGALAVFLGFLGFGGPGGTLIFQDRSGEPIWTQPLTPGLFTLTPRSTNGILQEQGIMKVQYKKSNMSDTGMPSVDVELFLKENNEKLIIPLEAGSDALFSPDVSIRYTHPKAGNQGNSSSDF